ncbi:MAG: hypothetical protein ABEK50_06285, partial [bacterium]
MSGLFSVFGLDSSGDYPDRSRLQEAMFSVYLRDLTIPLLQKLCVVLIVFLGLIGELVRFIYPEHLYNLALVGRFYFCIILGALVVITALFEGSKKWVNWLFGIAYVLGASVCGYVLSQLQTPNSAAMYIIYLLPLYTIIMPARLMVRTLVTSSTLLFLPGMYLAISWDAALFSLVFIVLLASSMTSILLGHGVFYRLNREAFFDDRELSRRQQKIEFLARHDQLTGLYNR